MPLTIYAVGDIMLGEQPLCENFGVKAVLREKGMEYLFREVSPLFRDGDIVVGNLECSIARDDPDLEQRSFFCASGEAARGIKEAGFTVLGVANNHIMENGRDRFIDTVDNVRQQGIVPAGIRGDSPILDVKGHRVVFLAYSFIEDGVADVCYKKIKSEEQIITDIRAVRSDADVIIVLLHWGFEYVPLPSPEQVRIGRSLVDAGADIILGGHPHVTQGYEIYRDRPILYSLGNFVFDQTFIRETRESFIAEIAIDGSDRSYCVRLIPILISEDDFRPELLEHSESDKFLTKIETVKKSIEDVSVSDYQLSVGDYHRLRQQFSADAKRQMRTHFVKNIHRYPVSTSFTIVNKRISRILGRGRG